MDKTLCIVGTGKVAQALIRHLKHSYTLYITSPTQRRAKNIASQHSISYVPWRAPLPCQYVIIARKDSDIEKTSQIIATHSPHTYHIHLSGMLPSTILQGEKNCSMHPIMSITPETSFDGVLFATEGDIDICLPIISNLGGKSFVIDTEKKPLYHTALVFISNFTALNVLVGLGLLREVGKLPPDILTSIEHLAKKSIDNVLKHGSKGLTGPAVRGDLHTLETEASLLSDFLHDLYLIQSDVIYKLWGEGGSDNEKNDSTKV